MISRPFFLKDKSISQIGFIRLRMYTLPVSMFLKVSQKIIATVTFSTSLFHPFPCFEQSLNFKPILSARKKYAPIPAMRKLTLNSCMWLYYILFSLLSLLNFSAKLETLKHLGNIY